MRYAGFGPAAWTGVALVGTATVIAAFLPRRGAPQLVRAKP